MSIPPDGLWVDAASGRAGWGGRLLPLSAQEVAILAVLTSAEGRVVPRAELLRRAGLAGISARRCDSLLVGVRRALGPDAIHNVRGRGWRLTVT